MREGGHNPLRNHLCTPFIFNFTSNKNNCFFKIDTANAGPINIRPLLCTHIYPCKCDIFSRICPDILLFWRGWNNTGQQASERHCRQMPGDSLTIWQVIPNTFPKSQQMVCEQAAKPIFRNIKTPGTVQAQA